MDFLNSQNDGQITTQNDSHTCWLFYHTVKFMNLQKLIPPVNLRSGLKQAQSQ